MRASVLRLAAIAAVFFAVQNVESRADTLAIIPADSGVLGDGATVGSWGWAGFSQGTDYSFTVTAPIDVTALAYYSLPEQGFTLNSAEIVSIYQAGGATPLASAVISPGANLLAVSTNVTFYYTDISPLTLDPGVVYQVVEQAAPGDTTNTFYYLAPASTAPGVSLQTANAVPFGGDFLFTTTAVPELSTWMMLCAGFAALGLIARNRGAATASA
jgi:hypothetical protein